jgi:hypothetical protein
MLLLLCHAPEGGSFFDQVQGTSRKFAKGLHVVSAERRPVLLHDCEEHIKERLADLNCKFAAELDRRSGVTGDADKETALSAGKVGEMDVHMRLRLQVDRTKIFELPLQCMISNFKLVGPMLQDITKEYEEVFEQLTLARELALRQVVHDSADVDVEYRQQKARYDRKVGRLRNSLAAWQKVMADCNSKMHALNEIKTEIKKELDAETQKYLKKDSLMAQVVTSNEKLDAEHESLKDVRDVYQQLEAKLQEVDLQRMAAGAQGADNDLRLAALRQQIRHRKTEISLLQRMEELARWRISRLGVSAPGRWAQVCL